MKFSPAFLLMMQTSPVFTSKFLERWAKRCFATFLISDDLFGLNVLFLKLLCRPSLTIPGVVISRLKAKDLCSVKSSKKWSVLEISMRESCAIYSAELSRRPSSGKFFLHFLCEFKGLIIVLFIHYYIAILKPNSFTLHFGGKEPTELFSELVQARLIEHKIYDILYIQQS